MLSRRNGGIEVGKSYLELGRNGVHTYMERNLGSVKCVYV